MNVEQLLAHLRTLRASLSTRQIITLALTFVAVVVLVAGSAWWLSTPDYRLLYADMEPEEASRVEAKLRDEKVDYRLARGGRDIEVPKGDVDRLRLSLSSEGLPTTGRIGFEIFDRTAFGQTEFLEQVNYRRALEGEIARTIATIAEVSSARVHIAMARESLFGAREQAAKASVVLKLKKNRPLGSQTSTAIANLVAASVEGLRPEAVVLLDSFGRPLAKPAADTDEPLSGLHIERQQRLERELASRVVGVLEPVVGAERVRVSVSARLNSDTQEETEERFDPTPIVRSRQVSLDGTQTANAQGLAGARGNLPGPAAPTPAGTPATPQAPPTATTAQNGSSRSAEIVNYEVSKTVRHTVRPRGDIARLSVAVILDDEHVTKTDAAGVATESTKPRDPAEIQKIQQLVSAAVGIDTDRGDRLTVENVAFSDVLTENLPDVSLWDRVAPGLKELTKWLAVLALVAFTLFFVVRPVVMRALSQAPPADLAALPNQLPRTIEEVEGEIEAQLDAAVAARMSERKMPVLQRRVLSMAQDEPESAARLLRSWLTEGKS